MSTRTLKDGAWDDKGTYDDDGVWDDPVETMVVTTPSAVLHAPGARGGCTCREVEAGAPTGACPLHGLATPNIVLL